MNIRFESDSLIIRLVLFPPANRFQSSKFQMSLFLNREGHIISCVRVGRRSITDDLLMIILVINVL